MRLTEELIRRKAEHHDGLLADLEELSLHQLEIERIEGLGALRKLRILYLQNNVIARMEGLGHAKDLRYLNLALNNVLTIEGLAVCEFLNKLDLTVNFISVGALELSVDHLSPLLHLRELYLMGNPCSEWGGYREFVVASLPQLASLDGKDITRSERLAAQQRYRALQTGLREMAAAKLAEQGSAASDVITAGTESAAAADDNDDESSPWNPATRLKAYRKVAAQKQAEEERKRGLQPEARNADAEQAAAVAGARSSESAAGHQRVRQVNEGRWDFRLEDSDSGYSLRLGLSKYLDSSLVDVDVHPAYVSVVIKAKVCSAGCARSIPREAHASRRSVSLRSCTLQMHHTRNFPRRKTPPASTVPLLQTFRLLWPEEVRSSDAVCQRSHATGELVITAPAVARRRGLGNSSTGLDSLSGSTAARGGGTKGRGAVTTTTAGGTGNRPRKLADEVRTLWS